MKDDNLTELLNKENGKYINPEIYSKLEKIAKYTLLRNSRSNTLNTGDVIHEAIIKVYKQDSDQFESRGHFYSLMTTIMRNLIVDHIRKKNAVVHGGLVTHVTMSNADSTPIKSDIEISKVFEIEKSIQKLAEMDEVLEELIVMRYYGGVEIKELADYFKTSESTIKRRLRLAKACMKTFMKE